MNVQCPSCSTTFRVDPAKVPAGGVRARCSVCAAVFPVSVIPDAGAPVAASAPIRHAAPPPSGGDAGDPASSAGIVAHSAGDPGRSAAAAAARHHAAAATGGAPTSGRGWPGGEPVPVAGSVAQGAASGASPGVGHGGVSSCQAARCAQGRDGEGVVQGGDHEELGGVRGTGGPRARRLDTVLPGSAERDPWRWESDLLATA